MFGLFKFGAGLILGAAATLVAMNYHIVRTADNVAFVPKRYAGLQDSYVDVRNWGIADWTEHPDFVWTLYKNDRQDLIPGLDGKMASLKDLFGK